MNDITLSPYKIVWVEFFPICGYVTQHDQKQFGAIETFSKRKTYRACFGSKQQAVNFLRSFDKKLDKCYECLISTAKQVGLAKEENSYKIPYTEKQKKEVYKLYRNPAVAIKKDIEDSGGFDNFNHWNQNEVAEWVKANYECKMKIAMEVAEVIM